MKLSVARLYLFSEFFFIVSAEIFKFDPIMKLNAFNSKMLTIITKAV